VSDKIAGSCFPGGRYEVYAVDPLLWVETVRFGNAGSTGAFTRDVTATFNVRSNSYIEVICWTAGGDFVWDSWGTPPDSWSQTMTAHPAGAEL
jgi:hypothetical protein